MLLVLFFCYNIQKENKENLSIFTDSSCRKDKFWCLHQNPPPTLYSYNISSITSIRFLFHPLSLANSGRERETAPLNPYNVQTIF